MNWHIAAAWVTVGLVLICILICLLARLIEADRAHMRDWRKQRPVPDERSSITLFRRWMGGR